MDMAHFRCVHGYLDVSRVGPVTVDGACLRSRFDFKRSERILGLKENVYEVSAVTHVVGLGCSFVEIHEHTVGMDTRLWVLATPVDGTLVDLVLVGQVRELRRPKRPIVGLRFVPPTMRAGIMNRLIIVFAEAGRSAGRGDLESETLPAPAATESIRRGDRVVSTLLRAVLSGWSRTVREQWGD